MPAPSPRRVFEESLPIGGIMSFWLVVSWLTSSPLIGSGARIAGLVMALTYAVVRGVAWSPPVRSAPELDDVTGVLRVNALALMAAAAWFVTARLVVFAEQLWDESALPGVFTSPADGLVFAFTATGVVTVVLYGARVGTAVLRDDPPRRGATPSGSPADD